MGLLHRLLNEGGTMPNVRGSEVLRHQYFHRLAQQFLASVGKQVLSHTI